MTYTPQLQPKENMLKTYYAKLITDTTIPKAPCFILKHRQGEAYIESSIQQSIEGFMKSITTELVEYENKKAKKLDTMRVLKVSLMTHDGTEPVLISFSSPLGGLTRSLICTIASMENLAVPVRFTTYMSKNGYVSLIALNPETGTLLRRAEHLSMKELTEKHVTTTDLPDGKKYRDFRELDKLLCEVVETINSKIPSQPTTPTASETVIESDEEEGLTMADLEEAQQVIADEEKVNTPHPFDNARIS